VKSIIFFYPSKTVGGAERLIARLAQNLSSQYNCYIVDYQDGIYRSLLPNFPSSSFLDYKDSLDIPKESYLISFPPMIFDILDYFKDSNSIKKILFWAVHPANFESLIPFHRINSTILKPFVYKSIKKSIEYLNKNNSLVVMDGSVRDNFNELYNLKSQNTKFLPIPIVLPKEQIEYKPFTTPPIRVCLLGRLSGEKIYPAIRVFKDLNSIQNIDITVDVIGDGDKIELLKEVELNPNIKVNYLGVVVNNLDKVLKNYDLLFATGTSTLEGAKLKVPSILLDDSYNEITTDYKYKWIYNTKDYVLGSYIPSKYNRDNDLTMQDIIDNISNNTKKEDIASRCYEYVKNNHSLEEVSKALINELNTSILDFKTLKKLPLNNIYFNTLRKVLSRVKSL